MPIVSRSRTLRLSSSLKSLLLAGAALMLAACGGSSSGGDTPRTATYPIAGTIGGLTTDGLVLRNNGGDDLSVPAHATSFQFSTQVASGAAYDVTIAHQPAALTCSISHGAGSNVNAAVADIVVTCSDVTYAVSGTITGLTIGGLVLRNNNGDDLAVPANATTFQFSQPVSAGGGYQVVVATQPAGLTCTVSGGVGTAQGLVDSVRVACSTSTVTVGGTISGLVGSGLVLLNNGGDNLALAANATAFEFATPVAYGSHYAVTVGTPPAGQSCQVTNASATATATVANIAVVCTTIPVYTVTPSAGSNGAISPSTAQQVNTGGSLIFVATPDTGYAVDLWTVDGSTIQTGGSTFALNNVTANHAVAVSFAQVVLNSSVASIALSVNDITTNAALTGTPRHIAITNTGSIAATNVSIAYPTWPSGTTASSSCGSSLAAGGTCIITITPGSVATSTCTIGSAPTPGTIDVSHDAGTTSIDVLVLGYGCLYQGGQLFSIDDTTSDSGSIGGKVVAINDQSPGAQWSDSFGVGITTGASNTADGAANTAVIVNTLGASAGAANLCINHQIDSAGNTPCATGTCYTNWYLPALCEQGYDPGGGNAACGTAATPAIQNIQSSLVDPALNNSPQGVYWSSTEFDPPNAWFQAAAPHASSQNIFIKDTAIEVRCTRAVSQ